MSNEVYKPAGSKFAPAVDVAPQKTDLNPAKTLGVGSGVPWKSHTEYRAHKQAEAAGGFKHHMDDMHAGVKSANKEARSRYDATHRHPIGGGN